MQGHNSSCILFHLIHLGTVQLLSQPPVWRQILRQNFTDLLKLADFLELTAEQRLELLSKPRFAINVPKRLAEKMAKGEQRDPLFKQFIPAKAENISTLNFVADPVGDTACRKEQKLLHKYHGRVLLVCTGACAMHCRYCFRQNFDYDPANNGFDEELRLIASDATINEVILSGGDPLSLDNRVLEFLINGLSAISHIRKIRFHTRFPIGIPERIDEGFLSILKKTPLQFWFLIHTNHARELDRDIFQALKAIQKLGIPVLSQTVLLKGVNDDVETLAELCSVLVDNGIMPYYLHQLDRVQGAAHFEVAEEHGRALIAALSMRLPGYAVPKYVREVAGMPSKTMV